jgi:polyferredoxin/ferredoxin
MNWMKSIRVIVSVAVLIGLTLVLAGSQPSILVKVGSWLAALQFLPSLLALTASASLSLACVAIVIATLLVGRVYCSFLCPLGALQDLIARIASIPQINKLLGRKKQNHSYATPVPRIRAAVLLITILGIVFGWAGLFLSLLDPYSNFGRIVSQLIRPLLRLVFRAVPSVASVKEVTGAYPVTAHWAGLGALLVPLVALIVVSVMAALRGRLYCNTVCPVGSLLGFLSRHAAFRLKIDAGCLKCHKCVRVCKAQCIDPRSGSIDHSRCISCYNCIPVCAGSFIGHRLHWGKKASTSLEPIAVLAPENNAENLVALNSRRRAVITSGALALVGVVGSELIWASESKGKKRDYSETDEDDLSASPRDRRPVRPPGSISVERFIEHCTACQLCVSVCPTHVLQPSSLRDGIASLMKPKMDYATSFCDYDCKRCGDVCPSGALSTLSLVEKKRTRIGLATFDASRCTVETKRIACTICIDHCPAKAIDTAVLDGNLRLPHVKALLCIGCGRCEHDCPVEGQKAITVFGLIHETHVPVVLPGAGSIKNASA